MIALVCCVLRAMSVLFVLGVAGFRLACRIVEKNTVLYVADHKCQLTLDEVH